MTNPNMTRIMIDMTTMMNNMNKQAAASGGQLRTGQPVCEQYDVVVVGAGHAGSEAALWMHSAEKWERILTGLLFSPRC